jgi:uncharacterized protein (DUF433 family)
MAFGIVQDPAINSGRSIIEGTHVFVDRIIGHLEYDMSIAEICHEYDLTPEQAGSQTTQPRAGSVCEGLC